MKRRLLSQLMVRLLMVPLAFAMPVFAQLSTPVFKDWGTNIVGARPLIRTGATPSTVCTAGTLAYDKIAQASLSPVLIGTVCLDATWMDNSSGAASKPAPANGSITVQWLLDGAALGARIIGPPVLLAWDTTTATNGTHVISMRVVDSTGATYPASQFYPVGQTVLVNNSGSPLSTGAQTIPVTGIYHDSIRDSPAVDFLTYSGTPPHNTVYPYPYQFVAPTNSATVRPLNAGWFIESLNEVRTSANMETPRLFTTQGGGVVVSGFYHQAPGSTADSVYPAVEHHAHFDGGRDDNSISAYSTFVWQPVGGPCPTAGGWVGVDVAKRIFCVPETGAVVTIGGYQPLTNVLQYAWQDESVTDEQFEAKANNIGDMDLEAPTDIAFDPRNAKIAYVADLLNNRIAKIDWTSGTPVLTNYAGCDPSLACHAVNGGRHTSSTQGPSTGGSGYVDGAAQSARFDQPISLDMKSDGTLYIADFYNSAIRKITPDGSTVSTLVGGTVCSGCVVPSTAVVNTSHDTYSSPTPVAFSAAMMPYPQVIRLDSNNNLVVGESVSRKVRLVNVGTSSVSRLYSFVSGNPSWIWLDVDKIGTIGPINDIILLTSVDPGFGNTRVVRLAEDLSYEGQLGAGGVPPDGIAPVLDGAGHYPWVIAISRTEARFLAYGFAGSSGLGEWRLNQSNDVYNIDLAKYNHGRRMFQMGTVEGPVADSQAITPWPGWGNRPAFSSRFGLYGNGHVGLPTFDDLQALYPTDAALTTYIQGGMGGTVPRPEITGNDLRDLIYFIRRSSLQNGSERKPSPILPGPDTPDATAPLTSNIVATRTSATTMTVTWDTNVPTIGFVAWGSTSDYNGWSAVEPGYATTGHSMNVTGMPSAILMHFTVAAKTVGGKQTHSADAVLNGTVTSPVLSVSLAGAGTGTVASADSFINCGSTCTRTFTFGHLVTLMAAPIGGNTFAGWSGDCSGMGSCTLTMSSYKNVIATFTPATSGPILSITKRGTGTGTVTSVDTLINCGSTCTHTYAFGNVVTLTGAPIGSNTFAGWSGDCSGMGSCTLTMSSTKNVIATFNTPTASGDCTATPNAWCQTYPGTVALPATPPNGRSWNHLVWDPDVHKAMIWDADAGAINIFSNALYGYTPQYPNVATTVAGAWTKYSSCGTNTGSAGQIGAKTAFSATALGPNDMTVNTRTDLTSISDWQPTGFLWIGDEEMSYSSISGGAITISARGVRGTTAASHPACVGGTGSAGCTPTTGTTGSRIVPGCPAPVNGAGTPINDHPPDRHPDSTSAYGHGFLWIAGGYQEVGTPADTWHWDPTNNWVFVPPADAMISTHDSAIAYFADKDVLVRYGGLDLGSQTDIYCFAVDSNLGCTAANVWLKLTATNLDNSTGHVPPPTNKHRLIYDSLTKQALMFGGSTSGFNTVAGVWGISFNSGLNKWQWTQKANMPYAQYRSPVAFDSNLGNVVLFTAAVNNINGGPGTSQGETWLYDPTADTWTQTGVTGPLINVNGSQQDMVFNPDNNTLIMIKQDTPTTIHMYELADSALGRSSGALSVAITAPQPGSAVSGNIAVSATASDNTGTPQVQFTLDGAPLGPQVTSAPYTTLWNTRNVANGPHALVAILTDPAGNRSASNPVRVNVSNGALSVSITAPQPGSAVSGNIAVSATASDNTGTPQVQFTLDGAPLGPQVTSAPYTTLWNTRNVANGPHALVAILTDPAGNRSASNPVRVNVSNGALSVSITAPQPGSAVSGNIAVSATASDNTGTPQVQFTLDGAPLGPQVTSAPYTTLWNTRNVANGPHALVAILTDPAGNRSASNPVRVNVSNGALSVSITAPQPGSAVSGNIAVSATASDNTGTSQVQFTLDGATLGPQVTSAPYTTPWNTRNVANGPHALVAILTDPAGNRSASNSVSVTVSNANGSPPSQGVFRNWGWNYVYIHPQLTTTSGNMILAASLGPAPVPIISGVVRVDGAFFGSGYSTAAPPAPGSITIEYAVDGNRSGTYITGPPLQWDWDSTTVPDGTHVLSIRIVDSTGATYPADQLRTEAQTVVVQNVGPVNGAQRVPVPGFFLLSHHEPPAIDWVNYPGTPQHNNVHPYPYKFISPSSATELRDARNWFIEPLTETRHGLNTSSPHFYTTQRGGVVVQGYFPQAADTVEGAYRRVVHHYNLDGGRDDNMVDPYSTLVPAPDGTGWVGIDLAGRLFKIGFDGSVTTLAGFSHRRDVLQYDYRDQTVTDAQWQAKATQIGNDSFKGPVDLTFDPRNPKIVYVADTLAHRIAKVDLSVSPPIISTYVGVKDAPGYQDGPSSTAKFNEPYSLVMASDGTMYVADFMNSAIRKISPDGSTVSTLVGGGPLPSARVVAANRDAYSSPAPVAFASAMIPYPQVIRFDSSGNIVLGEMVTRLIRLINLQTHVVSRIQAISPGTSSNHSWIWLDVDTVGTIGPKDDIIVAQSVGANSVSLWRVSHDGSVLSNMGGGGGPVQDGQASGYVNDRAGDHPWIIAISKTEGRFVTTGFGSVGLSSWRILQAGDPPMNLDSATLVRGYRIWETGTVAGFPWGSRPSFSSLGGERGTGHLGVIPTFDDLMVLYPTDAALAAYIQNGMGGSVPRPEITGNDLRALIYFMRLTSLQGGSLSPVSPGPTSVDSTPPVISAAVAVWLDATTARVTWTTSKPCLGFVAWGSTSNYNGWSDLEPGYSTTHSLVVSGLPKTLIHFAVVAKDLAGNQSFTADATF